MIAALLAAASPTARPKPSVSVLPTPSGSPRVSWSSVSSPGDLLAMLPVDARLPVAVSVLAVLAWFALYGFVLLVTRPAPVTPGPPGQDLPGDEPPAVVSVLAADWSVTEDAAEATLLDLAARGYLELRQPDADPRHTTVHVTAQSPADAAAAAARQARVLRASAVAGSTGRSDGRTPLTRYEQQVLDHVTGIAVGGVVPLTALTFRDQGRADRWAKTFEAAVLADARDRGLIVRRVPGWWVSLLSVVGAVPSLAIGWLMVVTDDKHDLGALSVGILPLAVFCGLAGRSRGHRGTRLGREVAARWLGLRAYLQVDRAFGQLPPSAVAVWDRYLAYGDALGVTHVSSAVIDLGMANRRRVWSSYGGQWHQVRVRYPAARPRYGTSAVRLVLTSLVSGLIGYGLLRLFGRVATEQLTGLETLLLVLPALGGLLIGLGLYRLVRTIVDLAAPRTLRGEVLWVAVWRTRSRNNDSNIPIVHYLAVDDGSSDRTTAWALPEGITRGFGPGDVIEIGVRPWSRRVTAVHVLQSRHVREPDVVIPVPAGPGVPVAASGPGGGELLTAAELSGWFGMPLAVTRMRDVGMPMNAWLYRAAGASGADGNLPGGPGVVMVSAGSGMVDRMMLRGHRGGRPLPGFGEEAYLTDSAAVARQGDVVVRIAVPNGVHQYRDAMLTALGTALSRLPARAGRP